jgi:hypothetical protein
LYGLLTGPIDNWLSRRHEYQADRFALEMTKNKECIYYDYEQTRIDEPERSGTAPLG